MKPLDYLLIGVIAVLFIAAVLYLRRRRSFCARGCGECPYRERCKWPDRK